MEQEEIRRQLRELLVEIREEVQNGSGWYSVAVGPETSPAGTVPPFLYTVGLTTAGLPELILSGNLKPTIGRALFAEIIEQLRSGQLSYKGVPGSGLCLSGILQGGFDLFLRRVTGAGQHQRLILATEYQRLQGGSPGDVLSLQVVMPDPENLFPWEKGWSGHPCQEKLWR